MGYRPLNKRVYLSDDTNEDNIFEKIKEGIEELKINIKEESLKEESLPIYGLFPSLNQRLVEEYETQIQQFEEGVSFILKQAKTYFEDFKRQNQTVKYEIIKKVESLNKELIQISQNPEIFALNVKKDRLKSYMVVYTDEFGSEEEIVNIIDHQDFIEDWRIDKKNSFYIKSKLNSDQICSNLRNCFKDGRFFVTEISINSSGYETEGAWNFIQDKGGQKVYELSAEN